MSAMFDQTLDAEKAAAELANEQYRAGTTNRLDQAQQHLAYAETYKAGGRGQARGGREARGAQSAPEALRGADRAGCCRTGLPDLPATRPDFADLETFAASTASKPTPAGPAAQLAAGTTLRSEVREHYHRMLTAYDIAKHQRDIVVPLTEVALGELQLNYNAMLLDVYELLDATREQIEAGKEYVTTLADFWIAHAELTELLGGRLPEPPATTATAAATSRTPVRTRP